MKKINKTKSCFLEKINNINKPLTQAKRKKKKRKDQSSNISNEWEKNITIDLKEINRILKQ